ncbi:MAG: putative glycoside hydrolase [Clostridiales bacterium]|nr:putative glycoside hydrolase [Clostridiales bacterium]
MIKYGKMLFLLVILFIITGCASQIMPTVSNDVAIEAEAAFDSEENKHEETAAVTEENAQTEQEVKVKTVSGQELEPETEPEPVKVKGIYITGPIAGSEKMDELITLVEETELNAMVIDVKNDEGVVTYKMQSDTVLEIEAGVRYIKDMEALVEKLHEKDIYLIARIVAFKDPYLAEMKPELSLKTNAGAVFRDKNGDAWVNPYMQEVWDYLVEIGTQAAQIGFDEIQFDYIRFSTDVNASSVDYGEVAETMTKEEVITGFTEYAYNKLHPLGVKVSADVFGTIIDNEYDAALVGQNYQKMAAYLDYICPMVYPSHYSNGVYGLEVPDKEPYETVYHAMSESKKKLEPAEDVSANSLDRTEGTAGVSANSLERTDGTAGVRVWLQDFTATWVKGHITYGAAEVRAQIQAVYDAGYDEWILWNARMNYTKDALLPSEQETEDVSE